MKFSWYKYLIHIWRKESILMENNYGKDQKTDRWNCVRTTCRLYQCYTLMEIAVVIRKTGADQGNLKGKLKRIKDRLNEIQTCLIWITLAVINWFWIAWSYLYEKKTHTIWFFDTLICFCNADAIITRTIRSKKSHKYSWILSTEGSWKIL